MKRVQAKLGKGNRVRLPITPGILRKLKRVWSYSAEDPDTKRIWAACCLWFFAFLRAEEMTTPDEGGYDAGVHLSFGDIALDNLQKPSFVQVSIKQSKTNPFRKGVKHCVGRTDSDLCPVGALLSYLQCRGSALFVFKDGQFLSRKRFEELVRDGLARTDVDQEKYCGHSFRIGAALPQQQKG